MYETMQGTEKSNSPMRKFPTVSRNAVAMHENKVIQGQDKVEQ